jgi:ankyrin repeat protein
MIDADVKRIAHVTETVPRLRQHEFTALQRVARGGHLEIVKMLLQANADLNVPAANHGRTALQVAAESGSIDVVKVL